MHDIETRQLAWDCALLTGFRDGLRLKKTFTFYVRMLGMKDGDSLDQALDSVKRTPSPAFHLSCGTQFFIAQQLPSINDKLYSLFFSDKKRDINDVILSLNKSSVDTVEAQKRGNDLSRASWDVKIQNGTVCAPRSKWGIAHTRSEDWKFY